MTLAFHEETGFSLRLPHASVDCGKCHDPALPYAGRHPDPAESAEPRIQDRCLSCHRDVHGGQFLARGQACLDCHAREAFQPSRFDREAHARVFPLADAHQAVECRSCHKEDPKTGVRAFIGLPRDCRGCHTDPHQGQFAREGQAACTDCHGTRSFVPALFGQERHEAVFALQGLHRAVACVSCHPFEKGVEEGTRMRVFKGSPRECKGCHADPHGGQFGKELLAGDCTVCHSPRSDTFSIPGFDHSGRTGYALVGSHAKAGCRQCHQEETPQAAAPGAAAFRVFRGTTQTCSSCHLDIHRGQFRRDGVAPCADCHASPEGWKLLKFDHNRQARFALDGSHAGVPCGKCHPQVRLKDGSLLTQYKPLGTQCRDCHEITAH
jgi:nitrate/TMAO reductase-like tetraheme cytochrome c subunit